MCKGVIISLFRKLEGRTRCFCNIDAGMLFRIVAKKFDFQQEKKVQFATSRDFFRSFTLNFSILMLVLLPVDFIIRYFTSGQFSNSLYPIQAIEAYIVYIVQTLLGIPVTLSDPVTLQYTAPPVVNSLWIAAVCTGVREIVFLSILILCFPMAKKITKLKWTVLLGSVLFVINLIRIIVIYPLTTAFGEAFAGQVHYYFWNYGQLIIVMLLFVLWFMFVARREVGEKLPGAGRNK